jgi:hypothetical protein
MIKIQLSNASNGIVKTITDTQYNGADQVAKIVVLYELDEDNQEEYLDKVANLFSDLSKDLGLNTGSDFENSKLMHTVDWGDKYMPSIEEIDLRIKDLKEDIKVLNSLKKSFLSEDEE